MGGGTYYSTLDHCTLTGNGSGSAGGAASFGSMNNCLVQGNSSFNGGGVFFTDMTNCTVAFNTAGNASGGTANGNLVNCIVYFNTGGGFPNYSGGSYTYTCTTPLPGGAGNTAGDPLFVATNDLRLAPNSPCLNSGNNAAAAGTNDLAGNARIVAGTVDMGAYEYVGYSVDSDGDGFVDYDEYLADTQPTNGASYFPRITTSNAPLGTIALKIATTSVGRVYFVRSTTNLLASPQIWTLVPPEQTGTAGAITFSVTNDVPGRNYRTGVRLP
jgi:hypothetical protein